MYAVQVTSAHIIIHRSDSEAAAKDFIRNLKAKLLSNRLKADGTSHYSNEQREKAAEWLNHLCFRILSWSECVENYPDQAELFIVSQVLPKKQ